MKNYRKKDVTPMRPYAVGENLYGMSVSPKDTPELGGMIAVNPNNPADQWYIAKSFFEENYEEAGGDAKTLHNSPLSGATKNVNDPRAVGDRDLFKLLYKVSSEAEGWMKSTKAMDTGNGCAMQVTTQQRNTDGSYSVAEALCFVPDAILKDDNKHPGGRIIDGSMDARYKLPIDDPRHPDHLDQRSGRNPAPVPHAINRQSFRQYIRRLSHL